MGVWFRKPLFVVAGLWPRLTARRVTAFEAGEKGMGEQECLYTASTPHLQVILSQSRTACTAYLSRRYRRCGQPWRWEGRRKAPLQSCSSEQPGFNASQRPAADLKTPASDADVYSF